MLGSGLRRKVNAARTQLFYFKDYTVHFNHCKGVMETRQQNNTKHNAYVYIDKKATLSITHVQPKTECHTARFYIDVIYY